MRTIDKKKRYVMRMDMTLDELVELKRRGTKVRRHMPFGLTPKEYGYIYLVDGYRVILKEDPEEIRRRLKEVKVRK